MKKLQFVFEIIKSISIIWRGDLGSITSMFYNTEEKRLKFYGLVIYDVGIGITLVERSK